MTASFLRWLVDRPWATASAIALATLVAAWSARNVRFDFTPQALFDSGDDALAFSEAVKAKFGYEDSRLMVVMEATGARDVLDADLLEWQCEAAERLGALPGVRRIDAVATLRVPQLDLSTGFDVLPQPVIHSRPVTPEAEGTIRRLMDRTRMIEGSLLSRDRRVGALFVVFDPAARDVASMRRLVDSVKRALAAIPPPNDLRVSYSGLPAVRVAVVNDLMADQSLLFPLAGAIFLALLGLAFRDVVAVAAPVLAVLIGLTWTVGLVAATGEPFNIVTNVLPILILIIGVSNAIHFVVRFREESTRTLDPRVAARETLTHMLRPCLLTLVTTALGFLSLATARSRVLQLFGWHAAFGMICLYLSVLATFAVLLPWCRRQGGSAREHSPPNQSWLARRTAAVGDVVARRPWPVLAAGCLLCVVGGVLALRLEVNSSLTETYGADHPETRTLRLVEESLGGVLPLEVVLSADVPGRFHEPRTYADVDALGQLLRDQPEVSSSLSYVDLYQEIRANFRRDESLRDILPTDDAEGRRVIERTAAQADRAREATQPETFLTDDAREARVLVRVRDVGTRRTLDLIRRVESRLAHLFPPHCGITARLTGDAWLNAVAMDGFVRDLFASLATASVSVFVLIAILFRSIRTGLTAALPNLAPFAATLGYMAWRGYDLNAGNVAVFSISLGLTVDNSIHFLSRFRDEADSGKPADEAIRATYLGAGQAMVISTLLQGSGLLVLLWSRFVPTQRFAELMAVTMAGTLVGDLALLPACVTLFTRRASGEGLGAEPAAAIASPTERPAA